MIKPSAMNKIALIQFMKKKINLYIDRYKISKIDR